MIPMRTVYRQLTTSGTLTFDSTDSDGRKKGFYVVTANGTLWFPPLGYRSGTTGGTFSSGSIGEYWCSESNYTDGYALVLNSSGATPSMQVEANSRAHAFGVRPMLE